MTDAKTHARPGVREGAEGQRHGGRIFRAPRPTSARAHPAHAAFEPGAGAADRARAVGGDLRAVPRLEVLLAVLDVADPATGGNHRHRRRRADAGGADRRHRPLGRRDHGALLGGDGAVHLPLRHPGTDLDPLRLRGGGRDRLHQRLPRREGQAAAIHRHARHVADRARRELPLLAERDDPQPGRRGAGAAAAGLRRLGQGWRRGADARRHRHGAARAGPELHPEPHGLGPACLRDRRRSGRRRPVRRAGTTRC